MELFLDLLPMRFIEVHALEFLAWSMDHAGPRDFVLRWPPVAAYGFEPQTIKLDRRLAMRDGRGTGVEYFIVDDADVPVMSRYLTAIKLADAAYFRAMDARRKLVEGQP